MRLLSGAAVIRAISLRKGGSAFREGDDAPGTPPVATIGKGLWKRRFGGDPTLLGKSISLNGTPHTVVVAIAPDALETLTGAGTEIHPPPQ
jgi:putative ABC transport system permease protein